ncbi:GPO family capsid scaffolding protein [Asticcacaulis machinosus]|uniref:GPO family capsid scaffolding protein n=1 Tax=Asticcacaulis machinosus TaxID=2984211 RepID=A0ABT5HGK3_9CAUL|nr:GPO family capsid scaffolding protein [Asticcacaulis machinosus]MDC7675367.1 GPO family capsid scaffolding protein [Asticcacaulis machinosus]
MAKSKFHRVATEGATADGRKIERKDIEDMAATYNRQTYASRVNMEHFRGLTADGPFKAYGDVLALKTEEIEVEVGGKKEKRLALLAQIDPTEELIAFNKKRQKLYTSIEINPNFAQSGKAYLQGLAVTDSPASLATEMLEFAASAPVNPFAMRKVEAGNLITAAEEFKLELEDEAAGESSEVISAFSAMKAFFTGLATPAKTEPSPPVVTPSADAPDFSKFSATIAEGFAKIGTVLEATAKANDDRFTKLTGDLAALQTKLETTPATTFTQRPVSPGGDNRPRADC